MMQQEHHKAGTILSCFSPPCFPCSSPLSVLTVNDTMENSQQNSLSVFGLMFIRLSSHSYPLPPAVPSQ